MFQSEFFSWIIDRWLKVSDESTRSEDCACQAIYLSDLKIDYITHSYVKQPKLITDNKENLKK